MIENYWGKKTSSIGIGEIYTIEEKNISTAS